MFKPLSNIKTKLFAEITSIPEVLQPSHLPGLDGLRGVSIIIVILSHFFMHTKYTKSISGSIGVWTFFVISGFLITTLLLKEKVTTGNISLKQFYMRRFFRIIPVAYLFIIVLLIINYCQDLNIGKMPFIAAALFWQNLPIHSFSSWYLGHFWSLSVEEQFYLTFPFILVYSFRNYFKIIIFLIITIPIIEYLGLNKIGVFYTNHIVHVIAFIIINLLGNSVCILIGSLASILLFKKIIVIKDTFLTRNLGLILFVLAILLCTETSPIFISNAEILIFPILIGLVIVFNLNHNGVLTKILNNKVLIYIGILSYSLYIWQQLFDNSQTWIIHSDSALLHAIVLFIVANASYYLYERSFLRLKNRFEKVSTR
jgi:peptidoglycan/LPS O-acetylase OafA/YrhL